MTTATGPETPRTRCHPTTFNASCSSSCSKNFYYNSSRNANTWFLLGSHSNHYQLLTSIDWNNLQGSIMPSQQGSA
eukprot:745104-Pelagomonas_calceolata.AAC.1